MQHLAEASRTFDGMAEGVTEVQQRSYAAPVRDIRLHRTALGGDALPDSLLAILPMAGEQRVSMCFEPDEEASVANEPIFHHFRIASAQLALVQCSQKVDVRDDQCRLM